MSGLARRWAEEMLDCGRSCGVSLDTAEAVSVALARARVVGVLDAWADEGGGWARAWESCRRPGSFWVVLTDGGARCFHGDSPDAARAAAAKAIEAHEV